MGVLWRGLLLAENDRGFEVGEGFPPPGKVIGCLGDIVRDASPALAAARIHSGGIHGWADYRYYLSESSETPSPETPRCRVDWSGLLAALADAFPGPRPGGEIAILEGSETPRRVETTAVPSWVINIMENCGVGPSANILKVGTRYWHRDDDVSTLRLVEIVYGAYMGTYGLSNAWEWRHVGEDGNLVGPKYCGCNNSEYGRRFIRTEDVPHGAIA